VKNKKIKICFFSPASYPFFVKNSKTIHGGAEFQMYLWAKEIAKNNNYSVSFMLGNYGQMEKHSPIKNIKLIKAFKLTASENIFSKLLKSVYLLFLYFKIKPDIIITTNASSIVGVTALYTQLFGKQYIYRSSSIIDVDRSWISNHKFMGKIYRWGLEHTNLVIVQGKEHKSLLQKNHRIKNIKILKNAFPLQKPNTEIKQHILWVSRFVEMKNPFLFLDLAKQIPDEYFVMICPYNPSGYKRWKLLKNKAAKIPNLIFIEKISFHEIQAYFNKAKIFINTSDFEGFPNTFLQAAQAKTPIVSLNVNPDNFLNEYNCGIFCKNDFNLLVKETKKLLQNPNEQILKGENAYRYLKENHNINKIGKQLEEIIYDLIGKNIF